MKIACFSDAARLCRLPRQKSSFGLSEFRRQPLKGLCCLLLLGALQALSGCGHSKAAPDKKEGGGGKQERQFPVRLVEATARPLQYAIEATGALQAEDIFRIDAQLPGVLEEVNFKEGDEVNEKRVLCRIGPASYSLAVQKAKHAHDKALADLADAERRTRNEVQRAQVKLAQAERDVARLKPGLETGAIKQDEFLQVQDRRDTAVVEHKDAQEAAQTVVETMRTAARQKETEWRQSEEDLRKSFVVPPVAGVIDQRYIANGAQVAAGTPIAQLVSKGLKLKFSLPETQAAFVREQTAVIFRVMAYPKQDFKATVYYVSAVADAKTRQVSCWARVEPTGEVTLKSGYFATVKIVTQEKRAAVVIPLHAAQPTEYGYVVFVAKEAGEQGQGKAPALKVTRRSVTLGLQVLDQAVEVVEGLSAGERFVVEGANALSEGVSVKELTEEKK